MPRSVTATPFFMGTGRYAPARRMIDEGLAIALGSNFNPTTSMTLNLPFILSLACTQMKMTPAECQTACTANAATALKRQRRLGAIAPGIQADLTIVDVPDYREWAYNVGRNCVAKVIKAGKVVIGG